MGSNRFIWVQTCFYEFRVKIGFQRVSMGFNIWRSNGFQWRWMNFPGSSQVLSEGYPDWNGFSLGWLGNKFFFSIPAIFFSTEFSPGPSESGSNESGPAGRSIIGRGRRVQTQRNSPRWWVAKKKKEK